MLERGITAPQGRRKLGGLLPEILADESNGLGSRLRRLIEDMRSEWRGLDERITAFDDELAVRAGTCWSASALCWSMLCAGIWPSSVLSRHKACIEWQDLPQS
jgi:hypothetical protein